MQALPDVEQAVTHACVINQAAATGGDARQLVGYLVSQSGLPLDTSALQAQLRETLPPHMVPVVLLQLPQLPLSANGKLDRKALPLPELKAQTPGRVRKRAVKRLSPRHSRRCWVVTCRMPMLISLRLAVIRYWQ